MVKWNLVDFEEPYRFVWYFLLYTASIQKILLHMELKERKRLDKLNWVVFVSDFMVNWDPLVGFLNSCISILQKKKQKKKKKKKQKKNKKQRNTGIGKL